MAMIDSHIRYFSRSPILIDTLFRFLDAIFILSATLAMTFLSQPDYITRQIFATLLLLC